MTDQEKLIELLHSWGIKLRIVMRMSGYTEVQIRNVNPDGSYADHEPYTEFVFDTEGKFVETHAWEY